MTPLSVITFAVVGTQRAGTTWLDAALRGHPEVYLPAEKQSYFFDRNYEQGLGWYLSRFANAAGHAAVGEVATGYGQLHAIPRLARHLPHIRIVVTVRHPVERAYSYYVTRRAQHGWKTMREALAERPDLLTRGEYIDQIEALLTHYPRDRLLILFFEDLAADDRAFLTQVLDFIGVDPTFESPELGRVRNAALAPRLRSALNGVGLGGVLAAASRSAVGDIVRAANKRRRRRPGSPLDGSLREELLEHFAPYNRRLADFTGRDLSHWDR